MVAIFRLGGGLAAVALGLAALVSGPAASAQPTATVVVPCDTGALVSAINAADTSLSPTTLQLSSNCTYTIFTPAQSGVGLPTISNDITLAGGSNTVITRSALTPFPFGLLFVSNAGDLTVRNLTLTNAFIPKSIGGAIDDAGRLTVTNSAISGNTAYDAAGVYVNSGASAYIAGTLLNHNTSVGPVGNDGGAIEVFGSLRLFNSVIDSNIADYGGGLAVYNTGSVTADQTTFTNNTARKVGGGIYAAYATGLSLNGSQVRLNTAGVTAGGIFSTHTGTTLQSTIVKKNTPDNCAAGAYCLN